MKAFGGRDRCVPGGGTVLGGKESGASEGWRETR